MLFTRIKNLIKQIIMLETKTKKSYLLPSNNMTVIMIMIKTIMMIMIMKIIIIIINVIINM